MAALAVGGVLLSVAARAGLVVNGTRFVLPAPATSQAITVQNTGATDILVRSQILADQGEDQKGSVPDKPGPVPASTKAKEGVPFVITPPLFALAGGKSNQLRLTCLECDQLPTDRESLFRLSMSAIPSGKAPPNTVQIAIRSSFKLFYRPAGLPGNATTAYQQLQWRRQGARIAVRNPTPYYVTLFKMQVNGRQLNVPGMVPPYTTRTQSWCPETGGCAIRWQTLDDFSAELAPWAITPSGSFHPGLPG